MINELYTIHFHHPLVINKIIVIIYSILWEIDSADEGSASFFLLVVAAGRIRIAQVVTDYDLVTQQ